MSYDFTIRSDGRFSAYTSKAALDLFIGGLPSVTPNGAMGFAIDDRPKRWMEIDLEVVSAEGDNICERGKIYDSVNCVRLHIPHGFLDDVIAADYLPTALAIAEFIGWPMYDDQTNEPVANSSAGLASSKAKKPWWRFW